MKHDGGKVNPNKNGPARWMAYELAIIRRVSKIRELVRLIPSYRFSPDELAIIKNLTNPAFHDFQGVDIRRIEARINSVFNRAIA